MPAANKVAGLGWLDITLLVASMLASETALIGLYFSNKNKSFDSYMLGDRKLSVLPVAVSLMTSCTSGLTLLGSSAELYYQGPGYSFVFLAILLAGPITAYTILPVYYRMNELSLYRYLERRYGLFMKYFASCAFVLLMLFYNSVVLYLPAMALQSIVGLPKLYSVLIIGLLCVVYSAFGGIKAVVWTDLFQACLMYSSLLIVGIMGTLDAGGISRVFENASEGERLDLYGLFELDLTTRHTLWGILCGSTLKWTILVGVNQVQIQRALALPTLRQGQLSLVLCSVFTASFTLLATYMGLAMYSSYRSCDPYLAQQIPRRDGIVIHYISTRLARIPGLRGIFIAGLFSATLSTLSSFSNSMAGLAMEDFIKPAFTRFGRSHQFQAGNRESTWLPKLLATLFGFICVLIAYTIERANSRFLQATTTMFGAIGVPFLAAFMLGIYTRFTNTAGIVSGLVVTLALGAYITLYQTFVWPPLAPKLPIYFDDECAAVFTMSMSSSKLKPLDVLYASELVHEKAPEVPVHFSLENISYMTLPFVQFVLTTLIACLVSLLTGGAKQQIKDECLVASMHRGSQSMAGSVVPVSTSARANGKAAPSLGQFIMDTESKTTSNGQNAAI